MSDSDVGKALRQYVRAINKELATGKPSEQSYYHALKALIEGCREGISAGIVEKGERAKPDISVHRRKNLIGVVEAKDFHVDLTGIEADAAAGRTDHNAEQFRTYLAEYDNLLYTNYIEWRLYRRHDAAPARVAVLGRVADGKVHTTKEGREAFENVVGAFLAAKPEPHTTAKGLALDMARLTKGLDADTRQALDEGNDFLKRLYDVFQEELIHGLSAEEFADMYVQTIAYGLFSARILHAGEAGADDFNRYAAERALPATNPFLRRVFGSLVNDLDMPKRVVGTVEDLAALIGAADMAAIAEELARFGRRRKGEEVAEHDPVIYFYEHFLRAYDPEKAKKRGVYYTPLPVVRYIVRSIDELLKSEFGLGDGLADPSVIILDPACGTGTFLYEVVRLIHERLASRGVAEWNEYVPGLLGRLFGFELLMAPYTIAHLKLAEFLRDTGYEFRGDQRLRIYLTNTLEEVAEPTEGQQRLGLRLAISKERDGADYVKEKAKVMVVLGNPPYAGHGANKGFWISDYLLKRGYPLPDGSKRPGYYEVDGEPLGERNPKWLQDDYVKFLRWAQWRIDREGRGIVGMITNHGYLDGLTFRGMRQNLIATFDALYFYDLHGNARRKECAPDGGKDENVFDIQQGVAVALFAKGTRPKGVRHADLYGLRRGKYAALDVGDVAATEWEAVEPKTPLYVFKPRDKTAEYEYEEGFSITEVAPVYGVGMTTARDRCVIEWPDAAEELVKRVEYFRDSEDSNAAVCERLGISMKKGWNITRARRLAKEVDSPRELIVPLLYRPFDERIIFYHDSLVWRTVKQVMRHMLTGKNLGMSTTRSVEIGAFSHVLATDKIIQHHSVSLKEVNYLFPIYLYDAVTETPRRPNFAPEFVEKVLTAVNARALESSPEVGQRSGSREVLYAEDIFYYIYGVLHSPTYRERYAEFLKLDFPRIPFPKDYESFDRLASAGQRLSYLHLLKDKSSWGWRGIEQRGEAKEAIVGKVEYDEKNEEVVFDARKPRKEQYRLGPVRKHAWEFHVGGYQVLHKWLKDRKDRKVAPSDYVATVIALAETDRIMKEECDPAFKEMMGL